MKLFGNPQAGKKKNPGGQSRPSANASSPGQGSSRQRTGNLLEWSEYPNASSQEAGPTGPHGFPTDQKYNPSAQQQQIPDAPPPGYAEIDMSHSTSYNPRAESSRQAGAAQRQRPGIQNPMSPPMQPAQQGVPQQYGGNTMPQQMQPQRQRGVAQQYGGSAFSGKTPAGPLTSRPQGGRRGPPSSIAPSESVSQMGRPSHRTEEDDDVDFEYPYQEAQVDGSPHMQQAGTPQASNQPMVPYQSPGHTTQMPQQGQSMSTTSTTQMMPPGQQQLNLTTLQQQQPQIPGILPIGVPMPYAIPTPMPYAVPVPTPTSPPPTLLIDTPPPPPSSRRILLPRLQRLHSLYHSPLTPDLSPALEHALAHEIELLLDAGELHDHDPYALTGPERRYLWERVREVTALVKWGPEWGVDYGWVGTAGGPEGWWGGMWVR
ncbi:MAG: hypothetical protein Q9165_006389 [Trypethelium subeluteriae]